MAQTPQRPFTSDGTPWSWAAACQAAAACVWRDEDENPARWNPPIALLPTDFRPRLATHQFSMYSRFNVARTVFTFNWRLTSLILWKIKIMSFNLPSDFYTISIHSSLHIYFFVRLWASCGDKNILKWSEKKKEHICNLWNGVEKNGNRVPSK